MKTEFEFIKNLQQKYSLKKIGDDCAVLPKDSKTDLVITTDLLVEDIDFKLNWTTPKLLGNKALSVSLSDVAAMGAKPIWSMISIGIPEKLWKTDFLEKFYQDWLIVSKKFEVELSGGDISKSPDKFFVNSTVAGEVRKGKAILRSGAKAGDLIFVSGELGGAAAGLKLLEDGIRIDTARIWQQSLIYCQLNPYPEVNLGIKLGENQIPSAMIDLSDGLSSDLFHICHQSKVGAKIYSDKIPFHRKLKPFSKSFEEKLDLALNGGEDFELLFTVNPKIFFERKNFFQKYNLFHIGEVTANTEIIELVTAKKNEILQPKGFRHF